MSAKNFDRDLFFVNAFEETPGLATAAVANTGVPKPRTDGVVYDDVATMFRQTFADVTVSANEWISSGVILRRPEASARGVYRVTGFVYVESNVAHSYYCGVAVAPASPTGDAAGEIVPHHHVMKAGQEPSKIDMTVCVDNFGTISATDYSERDIIFFIAYGDGGAAGATGRFMFDISVQRLAVGVPEYESKYR